MSYCFKWLFLNEISFGNVRRRFKIRFIYLNFVKIGINQSKAVQRWNCGIEFGNLVNKKARNLII